jgi:hypothetical protein
LVNGYLLLGKDRKQSNRSQVQGSRFRVKDKEGVKDPKSSLNSLLVEWLIRQIIIIISGCYDC